MVGLKNIPMKKSVHKSKTSVLKYLQEYSQATSFHGIGNILHPQRYMFERIFWILMLGLAIYGFSLLVRSNIIRFQDNPTVISLERDFRVWNTTFPAVTICYEDPLDIEKAQKLILRRWGKHINGNDSLNYHLGFLSAVANASFMSLENFQPYIHDGVHNDVDLLPLALEVHKEFQGSAFVYSVEDIVPVKTLTEVGLCYTVGSMISDHTSPLQFAKIPPLHSDDFRVWAAITREPKKKEDNPPKLLACNILNSLCYGRFSILGGKINYYVHSAWEVPVWGSQKFTFDKTWQKDTAFIPLITVASNDLRKLHQNQRKCLFVNEGQQNDGLKEQVWDPSYTGIPVVSYNLCLMSCRRKLAFHFCGCVPHFWGSTNVPVCKVAGLVCLHKHSDALRKLNGSADLVRRSNFKCTCYPQCDEISFLLDSNHPVKKGPSDNDNIKFRLAVEHFARIRLQREIIFGREDLLVSLGGTAGLFLGCSVLSAAELIYFFSLRLWFLFYRKVKKVKGSKKKIINRKKKMATSISQAIQEKRSRNCQVFPTTEM